MLTYQTKRLATRNARAVKRLAEIEASIVTLSDEDLLDLTDIFKGELRTPLGESATAEMAKRKISL